MSLSSLSCCILPLCVCVCVVFVSGGFWQGIDRSHSWVNSAYAPGGSRSVLRRNPNSSCELKQVQNPSATPSPPPPPPTCSLISSHWLAPYLISQCLSLFGPVSLLAMSHLSYLSTHHVTLFVLNNSPSHRITGPYYAGVTVSA